jgi:hypothetical protein
MTRYTKTLLTCAALGGLYAGTAAIRTLAADDTAGQTQSTDTAKDKASCNSKNGCKGKADTATKDTTDKASCKGKSGCNNSADMKAKDGSDKASCKTKSSCKSKDSCNTKKDDKAAPAS